MTTQEPETMLPGERLLAMGQREIDKGNLQQGAGLVWQATMAALAAAAKRHGMPCGNREEAVKVVIIWTTSPDRHRRARFTRTGI